MILQIFLYVHLTTLFSLMIHVLNLIINNSGKKKVPYNMGQLKMQHGAVYLPADIGKKYIAASNHCQASVANLFPHVE